MPELPEVQTIVNDLLNKEIIGKEIKKILLNWQGMYVGNLSLNVLKGRKILSVYRRAKYIVFTLSGGIYLIIHLRMTGKLYIAGKNDKKNKYEHFILFFDDGSRLCFHDVRKFGKIYVVVNKDDILGKLGVEPLDSSFNYSKFKKLLLHSRKSKIKSFLLNQNNIAGIGNIYADEALWEAEINPEMLIGNLQDEDIKNLCKAIKKVLKKGLRNFGTTLGDGIGNFYSASNIKGKNRNTLKVFKRNGLKCYRCGNIIQKDKIASRGTHYCPWCQRIY